jgi:hypothetical protein
MEILMSTKKYRPYLTLSEIQYLIESIKLRNDHISLDLLKYLEKYSSDIQSGLRAVNHTLKPTITESLGFSSTPPDPGTRDILTLINLYTINKCYIGFSIPEIKILKEYRFENSQMDEDEETDYVQSLMKGTQK